MGFGRASFLVASVVKLKEIRGPMPAYVVYISHGIINSLISKEYRRHALRATKCYDVKIQSTKSESA